MRIIIPVIILILIFLGCMTTNATSGVLFEDNFNSQADWWPKCVVCSKGTTGYDAGAVASGSTTPTNWDFWKIDEYWNKYQSVDYGTYLAANAPANSEPGVQIRGGATYVASGKALIITNEGVLNSPNGGGGGWSADGMLIKQFTDTSEVYVQYKMKFSPGYLRYWGNGDSASIKTIHLYHWDGGVVTSYFAAGNAAPMMLNTLGQNQYGAAMASDSARCDPQEDGSTVNYLGNSYKLPFEATNPSTGVTPPASPWVSITYNATYPTWDIGTTYYASNYGCTQEAAKPVTKSYFTQSYPTCANVTGYDSSVTTTTGESLGLFDGEWHTIKLHMKLNSSPGVSDGIYEITYDECQVSYLNNVKWIGVTGDINAKWNVLAFGGNAHNAFYNHTDSTYKTYGEGAEQWYAIDDVVISDMDIPFNYVIGGHTTAGIKVSGTRLSSRATGTPVTIRQ